MALQEIQIGIPSTDLKEFEPPRIVRLQDLQNPYFTISVHIEDTRAATAANYGVFFVAPISCELIEAWESHATAGSDASAVTLTVEKLTSGQALDAGVTTLTSTFNLKGTANTPQRVKASTTATDRFLKPGDRLALDDAGTLTAVAHVAVTVLLRVLQTNLDPTT